MDFSWPNDVNRLLEGTMGMQITTNKNWKSVNDGWSLKSGITKAVSSKDFVILLINTDHFMGLSTWSLIPDHYIQVTGISNNDDGTINVDWWSWGENQKPLKMTRERLYNSVYDYRSFK